MNPDIASSVIEQMGGQIDLLITLALGSCGGLAALLLQIALHNNDPEKNAIQFHGRFFLLGCLVFEGVSIICGYLARATITSLTPQLFQLNYSTISNWTEASYPGNLGLRIRIGTQALSFIFGVLFIFIFLSLNSHLIRGRK